MIPRTRPNFSIADVLCSLRHGRRPAKFVAQVKQAIAARLGVRHVVLAPSGRGGLYLLLHSMPEGRVCIPGYTCSAVTEATVLAGRSIAFIEHHDGQLNLTTTDIANSLRPGDIFVLTHQYGYPAEAAELTRLAQRQGATVIEDIAAAFGGRSDGKPLGSFGIAAFGSFDVSKLINVPLKGGFVATDDDGLAERLRIEADRLFSPMPLGHMLALAAAACALCAVTKTPLYRLFHWFSFARRGRRTAEDGKLADKPGKFYTHAMAEWQAAIALGQLRRLDAILAARHDIYTRLRNICEKHPAFALECPSPEVPGATVRFPIYARADKFALYEELCKRGVDCGFSFTTLTTPATLPHSWERASSVLNLPYFPLLAERELAIIESAMKAIEGSETC
jgi:dTDP-4-amino-4,6-dideoxygalactose transaminase